MRSQREVTRLYIKITEHEMCKGKVEPNRINCYSCACGNVFKTIDIDKGVTPMFKICDVCDNMARSSFYKDVAPKLKPIAEWYRPTLKECLKMRNKDDGMLEHILNGGLEFRKIK